MIETNGVIRSKVKPFLRKRCRDCSVGLCATLAITTGVWAANPGWFASESVQQGQVLTIKYQGAPLPVSGLYATGLGRTIPLYQTAEGSWEGYLPVSVTEAVTDHAIVRIEDAAGHGVDTETVHILNAHFPIQNIVVNKQTKGLEPLPGEMEAVQALKTLLSPGRFWDTPFISPTPDCENSPFGVLRYHNGKPTGDYHKGVDLRSPQGRPVRATAAGIIVISQAFRLHGGTVGIDHGQGFSSIYIHLSRRLVSEGQRVKAGDIIGLVGSTGFATGPHLHWGLYVNGLPVNPDQWLTTIPRC